MHMFGFIEAPHLQPSQQGCFAAAFMKLACCLHTVMFASQWGAVAAATLGHVCFVGCCLQVTV